MRAEILRPCMVIDNFIDGTMEPYSYEDYLRDFVNHSDYFLQKSNGKPYSKPVSESNGEWDCISDGYSFDFKLFTSQSRLQAARIFSQSITLVAPGVVLYGPPLVSKNDENYKEITCIIPYAMFRSLNFNEIVEIRKKEKYAKELEKEVVQIIKKFETKKNLMMFFPYNINFDLNDDFESGKNLALNSIYSDFKKLFQYRTENCAEYDTYIAFIYQARNFMIMRWRYNTDSEKHIILQFRTIFRKTIGRRNLKCPFSISLRPPMKILLLPPMNPPRCARTATRARRNWKKSLSGCCVSRAIPICRCIPRMN